MLEIDISKLTLEAVKDIGLDTKEALRCKNFWTLGLIYWLYGRDREPTDRLAEPTLRQAGPKSPRPTSRR